MSTYEDRVWDAHQEAILDDQEAREAAEAEGESWGESCLTDGERNR